MTRLYREDPELLIEETALRALRLFSLYHQDSTVQDAERRAMEEAMEWARGQVRRPHATAGTIRRDLRGG